jgi:hypothetical protein
MKLIKHILSDGTVVEQSDRKSNRSGYTGAALSPTWTMNADRPFLAACSNPTDPTVMREMRAQARTAWHGGSYADAREAAYVVARFRQDPIATEHELTQQGQWCNFPADLYQLPEGLAHTKAVELLNSQLAARKIKQPQKIQKDVDQPAQNNLYSWFKRDDIVRIARAQGGAEQFQNRIKSMTIKQFADEFGLAV